MKKYENLREFLADLVKYGKLYSEDGNWVEIIEKSLESLTALRWDEIVCLSWSPTEPLKDKDLVWCWNNGDKYQRVLRFWDGKNNRTFNYGDGTRFGARRDNYEKFTGEWPEWAKEAVETLED